MEVLAAIKDDAANIIEPVICLICRESIKMNEEIIQLPCHREHVHHISCYDDWTKKDNT